MDAKDSIPKYSIHNDQTFFSDRTTGTRPSTWYRLCKSNHLLQQEHRGEKGLHTSFHKQFNKRNLPDQTRGDFLRALKKLISRRRCPEKIYSDNAKIYMEASKWIKKINKSQIIHSNLSPRCVEWKFGPSWAG